MFVFRRFPPQCARRGVPCLCSLSLPPLHMCMSQGLGLAPVHLGIRYPKWKADQATGWAEGITRYWALQVVALYQTTTVRCQHTAHMSLLHTRHPTPDSMVMR